MHKPSTLIGALVLASAPALADEWKTLPILNDPAYRMDPTLAVTLARVDPTDSGAVTAYGLDFNFNCLLLQDPQGRMRTHVNLSRSDEKGIDVTGLELSPRYTIPLEGGLSVGIGPSLAVFDVGTGRTDKSLLGIGAAAGINYRVGMLYLGADVRYHETGSRGGVDYDHFTIAAKVGVNF